MEVAPVWSRPSRHGAEAKQRPNRPLGPRDAQRIEDARLTVPPSDIVSAPDKKPASPKAGG